MDTFAEVNRSKACRYGQMLYNVNDTVIGRSLDLYGEYLQGEVELFDGLLKPGSVVIEIGAGMGAHTLFFARKVSKTGVVIAFEPQRVLFQLLCANLALNNVLNTYCFQQAAGAERGAVAVPPLDYTKENSFGALSLGSYQTGDQVPLTPLDTFNFSFCHFLKIDVEGSELKVLQGAGRLIDRFKPVIYVGNDHADKSDELIRHLHALGYKMYRHRPPYFNPNNFFGNAENAFPGVAAQNLLCVHASVPHDLQGFEPVQPTG